MQCVDCHNRPTHTFELPERAIDNVLADGRIPSTLPYVKKESVRLLKASYQTSDEAASKLPAALTAFYRQNYPEIYAQRAADIDRTSKALLAIYNRNVFPELKVSWGTYPNNLGHTDFPGCFRCHDGSHATAEGKAITQDCSTCHQALAIDEASPEILRTLGTEKTAEIVKRLTIYPELHTWRANGNCPYNNCPCRSGPSPSQLYPTRPWCGSKCRPSSPSWRIPE
jgi:hypothetical protein